MGRGANHSFLVFGTSNIDNLFLGGKAMVGKANWDNCNSCLARKKGRKKEMLLSKIVKYKVMKLNQMSRWVRMVELTWLHKRAHLFILKVDS
jgi:hypothetical protein